MIVSRWFDTQNEMHSEALILKESGIKEFVYAGNFDFKTIPLNIFKLVLQTVKCTTDIKNYLLIMDVK